MRLLPLRRGCGPGSGRRIPLPTAPARSAPAAWTAVLPAGAPAADDGRQRRKSKLHASAPAPICPTPAAAATADDAAVRAPPAPARYASTIRESKFSPSSSPAAAPHAAPTQPVRAAAPLLRCCLRPSASASTAPASRAAAAATNSPAAAPAAAGGRRRRVGATDCSVERCAAGIRAGATNYAPP